MVIQQEIASHNANIQRVREQMYVANQYYNVQQRQAMRERLARERRDSNWQEGRDRNLTWQEREA